MSVARMKSVAYATEDSASDDSTARPVTRDRRSWCARCDGIGLPRRRRLSENAESSDIRAPYQIFQGELRVTPTGLADGLGLGLSLGNLANAPRLLGSPVSRTCAGFWPARTLRARSRESQLIVVICGRRP